MRHSYLDKFSDRDSFIHRLDPRVKLISFFIFIVFVILTPPHSFATFLMYGLFISILILLSRVPFRFVMTKSFSIIPFVLLVALFIPFIKKGRVAGGYSLGMLKLTVTYDGLMILWNCFIKAYLSILAMLLVFSTTKFPLLLKAAERLKAPKVITAIFSFMYRYIFVIIDELEEMLRAKDSRSQNRKVGLELRILANMAGVLFIKSYERAENIYYAMCSRGFTGEVKAIDDLHLRWQDLVFLSAAIILLLSIRLIGSLYV